MKLYSQWLLSLLVFVYNQFDGDGITLGIVLPQPLRRQLGVKDVWWEPASQSERSNTESHG